MGMQMSLNEAKQVELALWNIRVLLARPVLGPAPLLASVREQLTEASQIMVTHISEAECPNCHVKGTRLHG